MYLDNTDSLATSYYIYKKKNYNRSHTSVCFIKQ
jgi:hypothetical protein